MKPMTTENIFELLDRYVISTVQDRLTAEINRELQNELAKLSTTNKQIEVDSSHEIANQKPEIVIEAIKEMVAWIRLEKQDES